MLVPFGKIAFIKVYLLRFVLEEAGKAPGELLLFALLPDKVRPGGGFFFLWNILIFYPSPHLFLFIYLFIYLLLLLSLLLFYFFNRRLLREGWRVWLDSKN